MNLKDPRRMINEILRLGRIHWFIGRNTYYILVEEAKAKCNFIETKIHWAKYTVNAYAEKLGKDGEIFKKKHIDYLDALASQMNLETEWARKQQKSTDGTLLEVAENWNELIEYNKPEDFYESLRNLIMENVCGDSYFTEDKIHILRQSIEKKMLFLDYSWKEEKLDLDREPSDVFKLGKKADLGERDSVIKSILSKAEINEQESSSDDDSTFTGPIPVVKKTPQGIFNKRITSRGRGKRILSPSNSLAP